MMDNSLAKGIKNQLFREVGQLIEQTTVRWSTFLTQSKIAKGRKQWKKSLEEIDAALHPFLVERYVGGSKRKPFLSIVTLENKERLYNSWNERCIQSVFLYFSLNPVCYEVVPMGFTLGEHAILRIFERTYTDTDPLTSSFSRTSFSKELIYAPLWSVFWTIALIECSKTTRIRELEVIVPCPGGVLLGKVAYPSVHRVELRTFLSKNQLNCSEKNLLIEMKKLSVTHTQSIYPFLMSNFIAKKKESETYFIEFIAITNGIRTMLRKMKRYPSETDPFSPVG